MFFCFFREQLIAKLKDIIHFFCFRTNPLGMQGKIAVEYGELVEDLWSGKSCAVAPLKLRVRQSSATLKTSIFQPYLKSSLTKFSCSKNDSRDGLFAMKQSFSVQRRKVDY